MTTTTPQGAEESPFACLSIDWVPPAVKPVPDSSMLDALATLRTMPALATCAVAECEAQADQCAVVDGVLYPLCTEHRTRWWLMVAIDQYEREAAKLTPGELLTEARDLYPSTAPWMVDEEKNVGENWLIAELGYSEEHNARVIVTTDHVRASETNGASAEEDAAFIVFCRNHWSEILEGLESRVAVLQERGGIANEHPQV